MEINEELVRKVASLARLNLTDEEVKKFTPQLKDILNAFSHLDSVNTDNTEPSLQPIPIRNNTRHDEPHASLSQEIALKNAHHTKDGYIKGPRAV